MSSITFNLNFYSYFLNGLIMTSIFVCCFKIAFASDNQHPSIQECLNNEDLWSEVCVKLVAERIGDMRKWSDGSTISLWDVPCIGRINGRFSFKPLQWSWDSIFECPDLVAGKAFGFKTRNSAIKHAILDFLTVNQGLLNSSQKLELLNLIQ